MGSLKLFTTLQNQRCPTITTQGYLLGVRGLLVLESFVWAFLQTFVPAAVKNANHTSAAGPTYQVLLRKTVGVLFWNDNLIYSAFILLSARTICLPFLKDSTKTSVASACFRRGLRLWFPVCIALAVVKIAFSKMGLEYISTFKTATNNALIETPYSMPGTVAYFNSVFNLFWTPYHFASQAGSKAFPTQTLYVLSIVYSQSYTIYMTMVIIPFTRPAWRVEAYIVFIITAWWVQSWAWYSITGLFIADAVVNMDFKARARHGVRIYKTSARCPAWIFYAVLMTAGLVMQYLWTAWRPASGNLELKGHTGLYYTGGLNTNFDIIQGQARDDSYLVLLGFFLWLDSSDRLQWVFGNRLFTYLGRRSLSKSSSHRPLRSPQPRVLILIYSVSQAISSSKVRSCTRLASSSSCIFVSRATCLILALLWSV